MLVLAGILRRLKRYLATIGGCFEVLFALFAASDEKFFLAGIPQDYALYGGAGLLAIVLPALAGLAQSR
ncbi:MAG: hypothetical protein GDA47_00735 [Rhodospirillales bacterium]|nr:hypothetical protein [Rhodospirillales bacterium]